MWANSCSFLPGEGELDGAAGEHDQGEGGLGGVEPERSSHDEPHPLVESLETGVGEPEADRGQDAVAVGADGAAGFDEWLEPGTLDSGTPAVQQVGGFGVGEVTGEDGP